MNRRYLLSCLSKNANANARLLSNSNLNSSSLSSSSSTAAAIVATTAAGATIAASAWYKNHATPITARCEAASEVRKRNGKNEHEHEHYRIESHFMDRIQQKQYLSKAKDGIPSTFRVLAIDVPEMRTKAFTGECVVSHDKVFIDGVAPRKLVNVAVAVGDDDDDNNNNNNSNDDNKKGKLDKKGFDALKIAQKSLARSIVHCSSPQSQQHVGVELLEMSVSNLNRLKVRKKQSFGSFTYDPAKYYGSATSTNDNGNGTDNHNSNDEDAIDEVDEGQLPIDKEKLDEIEAPWNQYAWMEELRLRINGHIEFDAPVERSSRYERLLFGNNYKSTVPAVYRVWDLFMPFSFARSDPDGLDGRNQSNVRACNKPHAVIANGAALQLVPSSLRLLQKQCKKANIPLFVVHDPRQWGGNTQASLQEALIAMRFTVKNRIIGNALEQQGSSAFTRGRVLGQIETEAKWQLKDKTKRTKELLGLERGRRLKPVEKEDWSLHDTGTLENKLIERKVIRVEKNGGEYENENESKRKIYTSELIEIARACVNAQPEETTREVTCDPKDSLN